MTEKKVIFWFRQDLRIRDNPALFEAAKNGHVLPIYIWNAHCSQKIGEASKVWIHHSLNSLSNSLEKKLNLYIGNPEEIIFKIIKEHSINTVYWNRCYEPWRIHEDTKIKATLKKEGIDCKTFNGSLLWEPWNNLKKDQTPYKVFTPFYNNACSQAPKPRVPLPCPEKLSLLKDDFSLPLEKLNLIPSLNWHKKIESHWEIGESAAQNQLTIFINSDIDHYKEQRDYPFKNTSKLSPYIHFGEISPNQIWHAGKIKQTGSHESFLRQLVWREFSHSLLYYFPDLPTKNLQKQFDKFSWNNNQDFLNAWQKGQTGYPIIDAGMRELWQTGYMHNRVRMITASFLTKNLLIHWHYGQDWFWNCLVDANLANNSASWQWVAGCGADAAPYFRIFNPITQGEKFDPEGQYTKKFIPELSLIPNKYLFKPWEAPKHILQEAKINLGTTYPYPIIDLKNSRAFALKTYSDMLN